MIRIFNQVAKKGRPATLEDWPPAVGSKLRRWHGDGNPNNVVWHVRGRLVDKWCITVRRWLRGKQRWHYECLDHLDFYFGVKHGGYLFIEEPKKKRRKR